jgi:hypothetical protein
MIVRAANRHYAPPETLSLNPCRCHVWYPNRTGKPQIPDSRSASILLGMSLILNTTFLPNPGRLQKHKSPRAVLGSAPTSADPASPDRPERPQILDNSSASIPLGMSLIPNTRFLPNPGRLQKNEPRAGLRSVPTSASPGSPSLLEKPQILESSSASIPPRIRLIPNTTFLPNPGRLQKNEPRAGLRSAPTSADPGSPGRPERPQILKNSSARMPPRISLILNTTFLPNPGRLQKYKSRGRCTVTRKNRMGADQWAE